MKLAALTIASTLVAASALAQTNSGTSAQSQTKESSSGQASASQATASQSAESSAMAQGKVRDQLAQAGFKQVEILDASYLVRAQTADGNTVLMVIDPPLGATSGTSDSTGAAAGSTEAPKN